MLQLQHAGVQELLSAGQDHFRRRAHVCAGPLAVFLSAFSALLSDCLLQVA